MQNEPVTGECLAARAHRCESVMVKVRAHFLVYTLAFKHTHHPSSTTVCVLDLRNSPRHRSADNISHVMDCPTCNLGMRFTDLEYGRP